MSNPGPGYAWGTLDQRSLDVITYWLQHKHGADFIAVDGSSCNRDGVWLTNEFAAAQKFVDVYNWIRKQPDGGAAFLSGGPSGMQAFPRIPQRACNITTHSWLQMRFIH